MIDDFPSSSLRSSFTEFIKLWDCEISVVHWDFWVISVVINWSLPHVSGARFCFFVAVSTCWHVYASGLSGSWAVLADYNFSWNIQLSPIFPTNQLTNTYGSGMWGFPRSLQAAFCLWFWFTHAFFCSLWIPFTVTAIWKQMQDLAGTLTRVPRSILTIFDGYQVVWSCVPFAAQRNASEMLHFQR